MKYGWVFRNRYKYIFAVSCVAFILTLALYVSISIEPLNNQPETQNIQTNTLSNLYINTNAQITTPVSLPLTNYDMSFNPPYFDSNNYDTQYHDPISTILENENELSGTKGTWVKGSNGKMTYIEWTDQKTLPIYYSVGAFPFGAKNYVPSYQDVNILTYLQNQPPKDKQMLYINSTTQP